ncbi:MAG: hypothetical protein H6Q59_2171 [Firmicutes bacterium]|nr:hypothetical protein [Bacillota bacterium]
MAEINGITNVDTKNTQSLGSVKKSSETADFSSFLGETKSMDEIFDNAADEYKVPVELLKAIGKAESGFKPDAVSRCGAQGVMQLMPATAKSLGVTDSFDAEQNIMGGAKYIAGLMKKYNGNTKFALAAYNAGSGNVKKYGGIPPFEETQNYVKKVINFMQQGTDTNGAMVSTGTPSTIGSDQPRITTAAAAPVQNNYAFLIANQMTGTNDNLLNLDSLFSYDDYLDFLDQLSQNEEEQQTEEEKANYNTNEINYNVPVMNLLKDQKFL